MCQRRKIKVCLDSGISQQSILIAYCHSVTGWTLVKTVAVEIGHADIMLYLTEGKRPLTAKNFSNCEICVDSSTISNKCLLVS